MAAKSNAKKLSFEDRLQALDRLVEEMEAGSLSLEDSLNRYEEGMKLLSLEEQLQAAEQRLTVLRKAADGSDEEVPLEDDEEAEDEDI